MPLQAQVTRRVKFDCVRDRLEVLSPPTDGGAWVDCVAAPIDHRVRHDKLDTQGAVTLRYLSKLRHIRIGAAHRNRRVRLLVAGADVRVITEDGELLRAVTLEPNRSYYGLGGRWPTAVDAQ